MINEELSDGVSEHSAALAEANEATQQSEDRFRLLVNGVRDYALLMLDPLGNVASWNAGAERIKGYTAREIVGRHFCFSMNQRRSPLAAPKRFWKPPGAPVVRRRKASACARMALAFGRAWCSHPFWIPRVRCSASPRSVVIPPSGVSWRIGYSKRKRWRRSEAGRGGRSRLQQPAVGHPGYSELLRPT